MAYSPPTKGRRYIAIDTGAPFGIGSVSQLVGDLNRAFPTSGDSRVQLGRLVDAELDFHVRRGLLNRCHCELIELVKQHYADYPPGTKIAKGYQSAGIISEPTTKGKAVEAEALISMYLDGPYIVSERIDKTTKALNDESSNRVWPNIQVQRSTGRRLKRPIWENLLQDFASTSADAKQAADLIREVCRIRGSRTHARHFQVDLEHVSGEQHPVVLYASENPYQKARRRIKFSDRDRGAWSKAVMDFLAWWVKETQSMLKAFTPTSP